jgi:hypothetical protein
MALTINALSIKIQNNLLLGSRIRISDSIFIAMKKPSAKSASKTITKKTTINPSRTEDYSKIVSTDKRVVHEWNKEDDNFTIFTLFDDSLSTFATTSLKKSVINTKLV